MDVKTHLSWKQAWQCKKFRSLFLLGITGFALPIFIWPIFLQHIEQRNGFILQDVVLAYFPVIDMSVPIFICLWAAAILMLIRMFQQPKVFLLFMYSYWIMFLSRMLTIQLMPLNPPIGLLKLKDPISNLFYGNGGVFITKDLFFSGHTATLLLIFLFLKNKWEKLFAFLAAIAVGTMVLFQHIHYSIDVMFAPVFAITIYFLVNKWMSNVFYNAKHVRKLNRQPVVTRIFNERSK